MSLPNTCKALKTLGACPTFCNESISSAMGLSARYLTLFHEKPRRY